MFLDLVKLSAMATALSSLSVALESNLNIQQSVFLHEHPPQFTISGQPPFRPLNATLIDKGQRFIIRILNVETPELLT
jgi:hypothetical protein